VLRISWGCVAKLVSHWKMLLFCSQPNVWQGHNILNIYHHCVGMCRIFHGWL
jgi:hypothetical protein